MIHQRPSLPPSRRYLLLRLLLPAVLLLLGCPPPAPAAEQIDTFGLGSTLTPGSRAAFVAALSPDIDAEERAGTSLSVEFVEPGGDSLLVFEGDTDAAGLVAVEFDVPAEVDDPNVQLVISANPGSSYVSTTRSVYVGTRADVNLSTDKPVYQPGQTIHMRALALGRAGLAPAAGDAVTFTVIDPQNNKLLVEDAIASDFGIAAADFVLDPRAATGDYRLQARLGASLFEESVEVKPYTLPRFEVSFDTARSYYLPGDVVTGTVKAAYFFGKPVAGGAVSVKGFLIDVERVEAVTIEGTTDADGEFAFEFTMPETFVADVIEDLRGQRTATLAMEIEVTDTADHSERIEEEVTVAEGRILIDVEAEMGSALVQGVDNLLYISTQAPDGSAVQADVTLSGEELAAPIETQTDENGLAVVVLPATEPAPGAVRGVRFRVTAQDVNNPEIASSRTAGHFVESGLLLRPDLSEYAVGDTMLIDIYAPVGVDMVFLSVSKTGESHALAALPVGVDDAGRGLAQAAIELDGSLLGTLVLEAYGRTMQGDVLLARRYVLVNPAPAELAIETGAESYRPGETASLSVQMTKEGRPVQGALGISIVDESVFALGESEPGFVRTYFLLAREMEADRYAIDGFEDIEPGDPSPYDAVFATGAGARHIALGGFFAEELAARPDVGSQSPTRSPLWDYLARAPLALPLLGLALYDGTRRRRRLLFGMLIAALAALVLVSCAAPAAPAAAPAAEAPAEAAQPSEETTATRGGEATPPRLRQFFPETLFWLPELETDAAGRAELEIPLADSITTWRVSVVASDRDGTLGSATAGLRVFQEFFVEPDLPTQLTVGDEVSVPVSLYNYLDRPQQVQLSVEEASWFELTAELALTVDLAANEVAAAYIPIRVLEFGTHSLQVTAVGDLLSDAVAREVTVVPDGQAQALVTNGVLEDGAQITIGMPESSAPDASSITVKLYPASLSRAVESMKAMLAMPHGCFEQVTSTTYPNVLILDYLRRTGQASPELERRTQEFIRSGYQQLVAYEVPGDPGGFSYWGDPPPLDWLTAYGLMEFSDMEQVSYVDPALIERTATYLRSRQETDGSWTKIDPYSADEWRIESTAYVVWALANAGYAEAPEVQRGLDYLRSMLDLAPAAAMAPQPDSPLREGTSGQSTQGMPRPGSAPVAPIVPTVDPGLDSYQLALIANAFLAAGEDATPLLDALIVQARPSGVVGSGLRWEVAGSTLTGAWDWSASQETTALAAHALYAAGYRTDLARQAIDHLLGTLDQQGWLGTTQATVFTLKALLLEAGERQDEATTITLTLDGAEEQVIVLEPGQESVVQVVRFEGVAQGEHGLAVRIDGQAKPDAQIVTEYYAPWNTAGGRTNEAAQIDVSYDRTELAVNETVQATARIDYRAAEAANMLLVDLGVPPGFSALRSDWDALVAERVISRYDFERGRIHVYLANVAPGTSIELSYRLVARVPLIALTPPSRVWDYYTPARQGINPPERITVRIRH